MCIYVVFASTHAMCEESVYVWENPRIDALMFGNLVSVDGWRYVCKNATKSTLSQMFYDKTIKKTNIV